MSSRKSNKNLLTKLLHGDEPSRLIVIEDSLQRSGRQLMKYIVKRRSLKEQIGVVLMESNGHKTVTKSDRITLFDLFSKRSESENLMHDVCHAIQSHPHDLFLCVLDSLTPALMMDSKDCLHQVSVSLKQLSIKCPLIIFLHTDCHSQLTINCIESLADSIIQLSHSVLIKPRCIKAVISHRKPSRKITYSLNHVTEYFNMRADGDSDVIEYVTGVGHEENVADIVLSSMITTSVTADPTANLPFNLNLKDNELEARKNLVLPYEKQGTSKVYYEPDKADDYDDDDPDDDLDI